MKKNIEKEYQGILNMGEEKDLTSDLIRNYITSRIEERTELNKDEARGFAVLYSLSKDCGWDLITTMCEEFYRHMRSHKRLGIEEDIALVRGSTQKQEIGEEKQKYV